MTFQRITKTLTGDAPGRTTELSYFRIGPEKPKAKVYMQAALHADEQPGILVLHHLLALLRNADSVGELDAEFVLFPMVNPLGMGNIQFHQHQGRYDCLSGVNFNRNWPDLYNAIKKPIAHKLGNNALENIKQVRKAVADFLSALTVVSARDQLRLLTMLEAFDADYVFDLHCDDNALNHMFIVPQLMPEYKDLADWFGAKAILTCEKSGGSSFDEVWPNLWLDLARTYPDKPLPCSVCATTLEYRGRFDVFDKLNKADADALYGFFQGRRLIGGKPMTPSSYSAPAATDLAATQMLRVEQAGLLAYQVELGQEVKKGQLIADLISLDGKDAFTRRTPIYAGTNGVVISRNSNKYIWPGCSIAKIVGKEFLPDRGDYLLED